MKHFLLVLFLMLIGCNKTEVEGITVNRAFVESQSHADNVKLMTLVEQTLDHNEKALADLIEFPCGGASYCYDLGSVIAQIVYTMGEDDFAEMIASLNKIQQRDLLNLIEVGLEYGFQLDPKAKNQIIQNQFPTLYNQLQADNP